MAKKLILITGMSGSCKTTLANHFRDRGVSVITMGDVIRDLAKRKGLPPSPETLGQLATEIRKQKGNDAVARLCIEKIRAMPNKVVLVDGIRSIQEVNVFSEVFEVVLVTVFASQQTRYKRLRTRGRSDDPHDLSTFKLRDARELSFSLGHAIALADFLVLNEDNFEALKKQFERLLNHYNWM